MLPTREFIFRGLVKCVEYSVGTPDDHLNGILRSFRISFVEPIEADVRSKFFLFQLESKDLNNLQLSLNNLVDALDLHI